MVYEDLIRDVVCFRCKRSMVRSCRVGGLFVCKVSYVCCICGWEVDLIVKKD